MAALTQTQLNELQGYASNGDRINYWSKLAQFQSTQGQDNRYALLALGVAADNTAAGQLANAYMRHVADELNRNLSSQDEYNIGTSLMQADFAARNLANGNDIALITIKNYHEAAFEQQNLPASTWTAHHILEALGDGYWSTILEADSRDDWFYTSLLSDGYVTSAMFAAAAFGNDNAQAWIQDMLVDGVLFDAAGTESPILGTVATNGTIAGTVNGDTLLGTSGANVIFGFQGNDTLEGKQGTDYLNGGIGTDTAVFSGAYANYDLVGSGPNWTVTDLVGTDGTDVLVGVERLQFADGVYTEGRFTPTGGGKAPNAEDDLFTVPVNGSINIDVLNNDTHPGGQTFNLDSVTPASHGTLYVNSGTITYEPHNSYTGLDTFTYTIEDASGKTSTATVTIYVGNANDLILGTQSADSIGASSADEVIHGLAGNDNIAGYGGSDVIYGGEGNDTLRGGAGNDTVYGGEGNDTFADNEGTDQYVGGSGSDRFLFNMNTDTGWAGITEDSSTGFDAIHLENADTGDRIEFHYVSGTDQLNVYWYDSPSGPADFSFSIRASKALSGHGVESIVIDGAVYSTASLIKAADQSPGDILTIDLVAAQTDGMPVFDDSGAALGPGGGVTQESNGSYGIYANYHSTSSVPLKLFAKDYYWGIFLPGSTPSPSLNQVEGPIMGTKIQGYIGDIRLTVDNADNANLKIHFDNADTTYTYYNFEHGQYVMPGMNISSSSSGASGSSFAQNGSSWTMQNDDFLSIYNNGVAFEGRTFFMEWIMSTDGFIDLSAPIKLEGTDESEIFYGMDRNDLLYSYAGNDTILAAAGNDFLYGGAGSDNLYGGAGDDVFVHRAGDGIDYISESIDEGADTLEIHGRSADNFRLWTDQSGNLYLDDLIDPSESLVIAGSTTSEGGAFYYQSTVPDRLETVQFDDGTIWDFTSGLTLEGVDDNIFSTEQLWGTYYNDTLYGHGGTDTLYGFSGNDTLIGGQESDILYGAVGDDIYIHNAEDGPDTLVEYANEGIDILRFKDVDAENVRMWTDQNGNLYLENRNDTNDRITIHAGTTSEGGLFYYQTLAGTLFESVIFDDETSWDLTAGLTLEGVDDNTSSTEFLWGTIHDDTLLGHGGIDTLNGFSGNDTLIGGNGSDTLYGAIGDDVYVHHTGDGQDSIVEYASEGTDVLKFHDVDAEDVRMWTDQNGNLYLENRNDTNDRITIHAGTTSEGGLFYYQSLAGTLFESVIFDDETSWDLTAGLTLEGVDDNTSSTEFLWGTIHDDTLLGHGGIDTLNGFSGNDTLVGGTGSDTLYGAVGDDIYVHNAGDGQDSIIEYASEGTDVLKFHNVDAEDVRMWTDQNGNLYLENRNDTNDRITIHAGTTSEGGSFYYQSLVGTLFETVLFDDETTWNLTGGLTLEGVNDNIFSTEFLWGTGYDDALYGHGGIDTLNGFSGNDTLIGGTGSDTLYGAIGDDVYVHHAGDGQDWIVEYASEGTDVLKFHDVDAEDVRMWTDQNGNLHLENRNDANDHITIVAPTTTEGGSFYYQSTAGLLIESVLFDDSTTWDLTSGLKLEGLNDNASTETLWGTYHDDTLYGHAGSDMLYGYSGADLLEAGSENDTLYGGIGDDTLYGDTGDDYLIGEQGADTFAFRSADVGNGSDTIVDFSLIDEDVLNIADILSNTYDPLTDAITDFVRITDNGTNSILEVDVDGGANSFVQIAQLTNVTGLTDEDALETSGFLIAA